MKTKRAKQTKKATFAEELRDAIKAAKQPDKKAEESKEEVRFITFCPPYQWSDLKKEWI